MNPLNRLHGPTPWDTLVACLEREGISVDSIAPGEMSEINIDPTSLKDYLSGKNFTAVFEDSDLFWAAYCKAAIESSDLSSSVSFVYSPGNLIKISGTEGDLKTLKTGIESLRKIFQDYFQFQATLQIVLAKQWNLHMRKYSEKIDLRHQTDGIPPLLYQSTIQPVLAKLATLFDCIYEKEKTAVKVQTNQGILLQNDAEIIRFSRHQPIFTAPPTSPNPGLIKR